MTKPDWGVGDSTVNGRDSSRSSFVVVALWAGAGTFFAAMPDRLPQAPKNLNPFSRELLESMAGHDEAAEIVIGGGVALSHYLEYRDTFTSNQPNP